MTQIIWVIPKVSLGFMNKNEAEKYRDIFNNSHKHKLDKNDIIMIALQDSDGNEIMNSQGKLKDPLLQMIIKGESLPRLEDWGEWNYIRSD